MKKKALIYVITVLILTVIGFVIRLLLNLIVGYTSESYTELLIESLGFSIVFIPIYNWSQNKFKS